jgi:CubicO group peptidase (beta-lactamase class C family)
MRWVLWLAAAAVLNAAEPDASVVLAAEGGLLSLDDSVRKYIPELPPYAQTVTLRQMLHHTSGFRDILGLLELSGRNAGDVHSKEEWIGLIARQKALNYQPGEEYLYSNTTYFPLAETVARASGKPFSAFAAENIFRPLEMTHARFYDDHTAAVPGRVAAYEPGANGSFPVDWSTNFDGVGGRAHDQRRRHAPVGPRLLPEQAR